MGGVVSSIKETYVSTRIGEVFTTRKSSDNYIFRSCLIKSEFLNRLSQIDKIYKSVYQLNAINECTLTIHVDRLIFGLLRRVNVNALIETRTQENIQNALDNIRKINEVHKKYFINYEQDRIENKTLDEIEEYLNQISEIDPENLDLTQDLDDVTASLTDVSYSILGITQIMKKLLQTLKDEVKNERDIEFSKHALHRFYYCTICPEYRKWNYNKFITEKLSPFLNRIEIKIEELNVQKGYFDTIINFNLNRCIGNENQTQVIDLSNQAGVNLRRLYTAYRINNRNNN